MLLLFLYVELNLLYLMLVEMTKQLNYLKMIKSFKVLTRYEISLADNYGYETHRQF